MVIIGKFGTVIFVVKIKLNQNQIFMPKKTEKIL